MTPAVYRIGVAACALVRNQPADGEAITAAMLETADSFVAVVERELASVFAEGVAAGVARISLTSVENAALTAAKNDAHRAWAHVQLIRHFDVTDAYVIDQVAH